MEGIENDIIIYIIYFFQWKLFILIDSDLLGVFLLLRFDRLNLEIPGEETGFFERVLKAGQPQLPLHRSFL